MLKNMLIRALLATAALGVVAVIPAEAQAQRTRGGGGGDDKAAGGERVREKGASAKGSRSKGEAITKAKAAKVEKKKVAKAEAAKAEAEDTEAAAAQAAETHAKHMGKIERLDQIAQATNNEELKTRVAKLRELETKRHGLVTNN